MNKNKLNPICRIDRKKWMNGSNTEASSLLDETGHKCCLGFLALSNGYKNKDILHSGSACDIEWDVMCKVEIFEGNKYYDDNRITNYLIAANDNPDISDKEREARIIKHGKKIGVKFEFYN